MSQASSQHSNPFSTGAGGANFETRVQAAFTTLMLTGRVSPCLPSWPITKLKLQGSYAGFKTDDFIVYAREPHSQDEARLLAQIKHEISFNESDETFAKVIAAAWNDFNDPTIFTAGVDAIALVTGPLSAMDINHVRVLLEWARCSQDEGEFLDKVNRVGSATKRTKLQIFRKALNVANGGQNISDKQFWEFLKSYHLLGYDLDTKDGGTLSLLQSLIGQSSKQDPTGLWSQIVDAVQSANQNAGTLTLETLPREIREAFDPRRSQWDSDLRKLKDHGEYIVNGIRTSIGGVHVTRPELFAKLVEASERSTFVLITGGRGAGKSSLVRKFSDYMNGRAPIFCLRTEDLDHAHLDNVFSAIGLDSSIRDIEAGFALMPKRYLLLESIEKLLELENPSAFTDLLQFINTHPGWTVIATGRDYAYQQVAFNYLQPTAIAYTSLPITDFNDREIETLCEKLEPLRAIGANPALRPLLHNPFLADLAFRVSAAGSEFSAGQGEREFRAAVWRNVIAKEHVRIGGLPVKRSRTFVDMAVARAKRMVYGVPERGFDCEAVLKLEEDDLLRREASKGLISPAHDVLEDWALERYIDDIYQQSFDDVPKFLLEVGNEPAMNRAFRLWLYQKLRLGDDVKALILEILTNPNVRRYWQDETISAVLLSDNPYSFLAELGDRLFDNEAELLKRFLFVLRISCKTPNEELMRQLSANKPGSYLILQPFGPGWSAIIRFLFENTEHLTNGLTAHVVAILEEWSSLIHIEREMPDVAREAGLLALSLLTPLKDSYRDEDNHRTKLLRVIIKTVPAIHNEFEELLNGDVFAKGARRPHYVDEFCKMALGTFDTVFLCKHVPDTVIKLALEEFFDDDSEEDPDEMSHLDVEHYFGLHAYKHEFFPASGAKGPFQHLLRFHPRKGLDFSLDLLNRAGDKYAHSNLDSPDRRVTILRNPQTTSGEEIEILLDDQTSVKQCCSPRLWVAYRGFSVVPYLLQSALMALENWLISLAEQPSSRESAEWVFDHILRNSNSVMTTGILASLASGFPKLLGKAALPLLRCPALYGIDMARTVREQGGNETDWFSSPLQNDPLAKPYTTERRTAALRPWRQEHLETLLTRLQFGDLRAEAFAVVDELRAKAPTLDNWRFRFHRIDSRGWKATEDREKNRIIFESQPLEADLEKLQQESQQHKALHERFMRMYVWTGKVFDQEKPDQEYFSTWNDALEEARGLAEIMKQESIGDLSKLYIGSVVKAAAIFLRDHSSEMTSPDASWCADTIVHAVLSNVHSDDSLVAEDKTDFDGAASAASVLSMLFDLAKSDEEKRFAKQLLAIALTHKNANVRESTAKGIREHLWQRDRDFAQSCLCGAVEFARLQVENSHRRRRSTFLLNDADEGAAADVASWVNDFRQRLANDGISLTEGDMKSLQFQTHSPWYMLTPCFMVPDGSTDPTHVALLSRMLTLFFAIEESTRKHRGERIDDDIWIHSEPRLNFTKRFAEYLVSLGPSGSKLFADRLVEGCENAPEFIDYLQLSVAVVTENNNKKELYWAFWKELSKKVEDIAIATADRDSRYQGEKNSRKLIRGMLLADAPWQKLDYERQDIALGKDLILEFVENAGKNLDVFEALSSLMYHFPRVFFQSGVHILAKHQSEVGGTRLLSGINTAFYLEGSIQRFLQIDETGPLPRQMHQSCFTLLDSLVETASSRAYYLREQLIHSRRIL
ncbi:MAG TPA: ATP-binding protein [Pyrinomonadaceae bacterium]|nr:ATP-binding protein [Pyrinomonadaceae bacterium]